MKDEVIKSKGDVLNEEWRDKEWERLDEWEELKGKKRKDKQD